MRLGQQVGLGDAVDRAGAGKDEGFDAVAKCCVDQRVGLARVVGEVPLGLPDRFADLDVAGEVDDGGRPVAGKDLVEAGRVTDVAAFQGAPFHRPGMPLLERVVADRNGACVGQRLADVAADVAGAARDENGAAHDAALEMVPGEGFEPPTFGLQNRCTTTVLTRHFQLFQPLGPWIGAA